MADALTKVLAKFSIGSLGLLLAATTMGATAATLLAGFQDVDGRVADDGKALVRVCSQVDPLAWHWRPSEGRTRIASAAGCDARSRKFIIDPALLIKPVLRGT